MAIVEEQCTQRRFPLPIAPPGPQEHHLHSDYYWHPTDRAVLPIDLYETEEGYTLFASLPGTDLQDVQLRIAGNYLTIAVRQGAHKDAPHGSTRLCAERYARSAMRGALCAERYARSAMRGALCAERYAGPLLRTVVLPTPLRADAVCATEYERGVLTLHVVKDQAKEHLAAPDAHDDPAASGSVGPIWPPCRVGPIPI
jgi:HSP20 family molecular chaperone IbpA